MRALTSTSLRKTFKRFEELVEQIEDVRHVVAFDKRGEHDIFTFITRMDESISFQVYAAEAQISDDFEDLPVDSMLDIWMAGPLRALLRGCLHSISPSLKPSIGRQGMRGWRR